MASHGMRAMGRPACIHTGLCARRPIFLASARIPPVAISTTFRKTADAAVCYSTDAVASGKAAQSMLPDLPTNISSAFEDDVHAIYKKYASAPTSAGVLEFTSVLRKTKVRYPRTWRS
jgi:hypothetical protein